MASADFWELFGMIRYRFGSEGWEREREKHENAANLPLRECFVPKFSSGAAPLDPALMSCSLAQSSVQSHISRY